MPSATDHQGQSRKETDVGVIRDDGFLEQPANYEPRQVMNSPSFRFASRSVFCQSGTWARLGNSDTGSKRVDNHKGQVFPVCPLVFVCTPFPDLLHCLHKGLRNSLFSFAGNAFAT